MHLFEWEDLPWFPITIRNLMTDYLRYVVVLFKMYEPIVPILDDLLTRTGHTSIVDLGSGGGGPWATLALRLKEKHSLLKIQLTDLYPNLESLESVRNSAPGVIEVVQTPVDALRVPSELLGIRTQFLSLHHFRPAQVRTIFENAIEAGQPIAVFEFQERRWSHAFQFALSPIFVLLLSLFIRPFSINRILWTYLIPLVPAFVMWDGVVSVLRTYKVEEIQDIINSIPGASSYNWSLGSETKNNITLFHAAGYPRTFF